MSETEEIMKLRDKYRAKADKYWDDYQASGSSRVYANYCRNDDLARALDKALCYEQAEEKLRMMADKLGGIDMDDPKRMTRGVASALNLLANWGFLPRRTFQKSTLRPHIRPNSDDQASTGIDAHGNEISD